MKKILFIFGTFSLMLLSLSYLFAVLELKGSLTIRILGFIILALVLILGAVKMKSIIMYTGAISLAFVLLSLGFRWLDLSGYDILLSAGMLILSFLFLPMAAVWAYRHSVIQKDSPLAASRGTEEPSENTEKQDDKNK